MNKTLKTVGLITIAAAILYYPAMKLYQYIARRISANGDKEHEDHVLKTFAPAYRGKYKPHHRHPHNGQADHN